MSGFLKARTAIAVVAAAMLLLSACTIRQESREDFETAIPAALTTSALGITHASAEKTTSGFAVGIWVGVTFDHSEVNPAELREILELVVSNTNLTNLHGLEIVGYDGTTDDETDRIDLAPVGAELGFPETAAAPHDFSADWDDVVTFLRDNDE